MVGSGVGVNPSIKHQSGLVAHSGASCGHEFALSLERVMCMALERGAIDEVGQERGSGSAMVETR